MVKAWAAIAALALAASGASAVGQDAVETAYRAALVASPTPRDLEQDQAYWREDRSRMPAAEQRHLDEDRVEDLRRRAARDRAVADLRPALGGLIAGCAPMGLNGCDADGGWLALDDRTTLFWQAQRGATDEDGLTGAALLLTGTADDPLTPVAWVSGAFFRAPIAFRRPDGATYVAVPGVYGGTGRSSADVLFRWSPGAVRPLVQIDNQSWRDDLPSKLPAGLEVWKGVVIDYDEMFASTPLWRPGDGNCCPTGGSAILDFDIEGDRLVLAGVNPRPADD